MARQNQWVGEPQQKLDVPEPLKAAMRWRFTVGEGPSRLNGECAEFVVQPDGVQLRECLTDASDSALGITLKKRVTWREEMWVFRVPVMLIKKHEDEGSPW